MGKLFLWKIYSEIASIFKIGLRSLGWQRGWLALNILIPLRIRSRKSSYKEKKTIKKTMSLYSAKVTSTWYLWLINSREANAKCFSQINRLAKFRFPDVLLSRIIRFWIFREDLFSRMEKKKCMTITISNRIGLTCWKSNPWLYTKTWNHKHKPYATAFIDVDSAKKTRFCE